MNNKPLLEVKNLKTYFYTEDGIVRAVDGVSFEVYPGEVLGLVGESGCGKSVTSLSIMRLVAKPGRIEGGTILFDGQDLLTLSDEQMRQIAEVHELHRGMKKGPARERALDLLRMVGIPDPKRRLSSFPHEMSGGMAQ